MPYHYQYYKNMKTQQEAQQEIEMQKIIDQDNANNPKQACYPTDLSVSNPQEATKSVKRSYDAHKDVYRLKNGIVATIAKPQNSIKGFTDSQINLITKTVAKNATTEELQMFLHIAKKAKLDPFLKQIYFYKNSGNTSVIMTSRDGFLSIAQSSGEFAGLQSASVYENDDFAINYSNNEIKHIAKQKERGDLVGAWAKTFRKNSEPNITYVKFETYNKGWNVWKTHPDAMIIKCAESISLKKTFGVSGIVSQEEMGFDTEKQELLFDGNKLFKNTLELIQKVPKESKNQAIENAINSEQFSKEQIKELEALKILDPIKDTIKK